MRHEGSGNLLWFLAGLGLGTAAGVLLAPKSGADTRRWIGSHGHEYYEYGRDLYDKGRQLADEAAEMYDEGRRLFEDASDSEAEAQSA